MSKPLAKSTTTSKCVLVAVEKRGFVHSTRKTEVVIFSLKFNGIYIVLLKADTLRNHWLVARITRSR